MSEDKSVLVEYTCNGEVVKASFVGKSVGYKFFTPEVDIPDGFVPLMFKVWADDQTHIIKVADLVSFSMQG